MPIRIVAVDLKNDAKLNEIANYLVKNFENSVKARTVQVEADYNRWMKNYSAEPMTKVRSSPFPNASNFIPQLIRMHTDILTARVLGILFGTRPFWRPTTFLSDGYTEQMNSLAAWMQYVSFSRVNMYPTVDSIVHETFKAGVVTLKKRWEEASLWIPSSGMADDGTMKESEAKMQDVRMDICPFEDFYPFPLTAKRLEFCEIKYHRLRMTEATVKAKMQSNVWNEDACKLLLNMKDTMGGSTTTQQTFQRSGITLTPDIGLPFTAVEAHFEYELSPGKKSPLVCVFNPLVMGKQSILRFYYKPGSDPFLDAFTDFRFMPKNSSYYGDCVPSILEGSQEEQAQIHNSRRDSNKIANVPAWKKKRYADVASPSTEWYPGKVFEVDNMDDLVPLEFAGNYNSMVDEEQFLLTLAERYTGVSPAMQGLGAGVNGKRGTYASQGTLAMIAEGNRRIDIYLKRCRMPFNNVGQFIYKSYRDFGDANDWSQWGKHAVNLVELFKKDSTLPAGQAFFELSASDAGANRETDRSGMLLMANTMSSYYHELVQAAQVVAGIPEGQPFRELMLEVLDGARDLANRLLFLFDIGDRDKLLPDLRKLLTSGQAGPGGPGAGPGASLVNGLPEPQGDVSVGGVQDLSQHLGALASARGSGMPQ